MDIYQNFASVYDVLTEDVEYEKIFHFIETLFQKHMSYKPHLVLELACGTGNLTQYFDKNGYDVIASDASEDMLNVARTKCGKNVLFLRQDMTDFELYGTVDAICCMLDSVNYLQSPEELLRTFQLAENYLEYGGLLVFDINSKHKLTNTIGENTFIRETDQVFSVWENEQDYPYVNFHLNFFVTENDGESYTRFYEQHTERIFEQSEIVDLLKKAGFCNIACYGDGALKPPGEQEERLYFVASKKQNQTGNKIKNT